MKRVLTIALSLLMLNFTSYGKTWSLKDCIDYALEHNISLKQSAGSVAVKEIELNTARGNRLPDLQAYASQNFSFGRGLSEDNTYVRANTGNTSFSLGTSVPLFQGMRIKNNILMSRLDLKAATEDLEKARDDIRIAVVQAYVQALYDMEICDVARQQIAIDSSEVVRLRQMELLGKASESQVAAQEASLASSVMTSVQAEGNLKIALLDLAQLLELDDPENMQIERPDISDISTERLPLPGEVFQEALGIRPSVKAEETRLEQAFVNVAYAKGSYYPSLSLSGGLGSNYYFASNRASAGFADQMKNNFSPSLGLSLSIPIFNKFQTRNNVRTAKVYALNQELQLESVKKTLFKDIQQAYYGAATAREKYASSISANKSAGKSFELMKAKYDEGKANITEFNEAKMQLLQSLSDLAKARYECMFQRSLLNFYRGVDF